MFTPVSAALSSSLHTGCAVADKLKDECTASIGRFELIALILQDDTGCLKKKGDLFYDHYLHQIKYKFTGYLFNLKGGIHSSIWCTKAILYHIREPRYKQRNIGYKISKI